MQVGQSYFVLIVSLFIAVFGRSLFVYETIPVLGPDLMILMGLPTVVLETWHDESSPCNAHFVSTKKSLPY